MKLDNESTWLDLVIPLQGVLLGVSDVSVDGGTENFQDQHLHVANVEILRNCNNGAVTDNLRDYQWPGSSIIFK